MRQKKTIPWENREKKISLAPRLFVTTQTIGNARSEENSLLALSTCSEASLWKHVARKNCQQIEETFAEFQFCGNFKTYERSFSLALSWVIVSFLMYFRENKQSQDFLSKYLANSAYTLCNRNVMLSLSIYLL